MENNKEADEPEEFIESSQVPTLRPKIREIRPEYTFPKLVFQSKKKAYKRSRDKKTVSQCLRQAWHKRPRKSSTATATSAVTNVTAPEEDYITFASQREAANGNGIHCIPSVSLFHQQDNALARYIFNETTEAQVEAELEKLLDGFQAEYEQKCAELERSPAHYADVEHATRSQSTHLPGTNVESERVQAKEGRATVTPLALVNDAISNRGEEVQRMEEMLEKENPLQSNLSLLPVSTILPVAEIREEIPKTAGATGTIPIATGNVCLDMSKQKDHSTVETRQFAVCGVCSQNMVVEERPTTKQKHSAQLLNANPPYSRVDEVLDLRVNKCQPVAATVINYCVPTLVSPRPSIAGTSDCGTQTNLRTKRRNVAVQHRPIASFEFTDRNIIVLAQQFEADPSLLQRKLKGIAKTSTEAIWRARDLSTVFTTADPYYANLKHFL